MKKYIVLLCIFQILFSSCSTVIKDNSKSYIYYELALNFIENDSTAIKFISNYLKNSSHSSLRIAVSPKIFPLYVAGFGSFAIKNKLIFTLDGRLFDYKKSITDSLIKFENTLFYEPFEDDKLYNFHREDNTNAIIFFSKFHDDFLTASLFYKDKNLPDDKMPEFQASLDYLIIFNDNKIDKVLTQVASR